MRKNLVWTSLILMLAVASITALATRVQAAPVTEDGITVEHRWIGFVLNGVRDEYYGEIVVAYKEKSTAVLIVSIQNENTIARGKPINVSAVQAKFDWTDGTYKVPENVLSVDNPLVIPYGENRIVTLSFKVPSTVNATYLYLHSYTLSVEHMSALKPATYTTRTISEFITNFAVYSSDQADAVELSKIIDGLTQPTFTSTRANLLWLKSNNETATAKRYYSKGEFDTAMAHFEAALDHRNQAYMAEETYGVAKEELDLKVGESIINMNNSVGNFMVLFGAALLLFGLGYLLKGFAALLKKPAVPT